LRSEVNSTDISVSGYSIVRYNRPTASRRGGVALLICDSLSFQVHSISHPAGSHVDTVGIILHINRKKIAVVCLYRPPRSPLSDLGHIEASLSEVACCSDFIVCMGDFNINMLSQTDIGTKQMRSLMSLFSLRQVVDSSTRIMCSSESLIDLILVSSGVDIVESCTYDAFSISAVCAVLRFRRPLRRSRVFLYRNLKSISPGDIEAELARIDWSPIFNFTCVDAIVSFFESALLTVFDRLAPITCGRSSRPPAPWINVAVRKLTALKSRALNRFRNTRSSADWT
ncbi:hypothetical protein ALC57_12174, partial [Trachymyrmex cornetzi]